MTPESDRGAYELIRRSLREGLTTGEDGVLDEEVATLAGRVLTALRDAYEATFFGGPEHHCIEEQGCRACAISHFLGTSASDDSPSSGGAE